MNMDLCSNISDCLHLHGLMWYVARPHTVVIPIAHNQWGTMVAQWLRCCVTNRKVIGSIPTGVSGFFIDIKSFRLHYGPGVDSASNRNEYQEYFLGGEGGRCVRLTTCHHPVPLSRNLGTWISWNPLGPSGPVTGLLYLYLYLFWSVQMAPFIAVFTAHSDVLCCLSLVHHSTLLFHLREK